MKFSENLKRIREEAGYKTAKDFSVAVGIPYTTYFSYEDKGREPKYAALCKIAEKLNVSIDELLGRDRSDVTPLETAKAFARRGGIEISPVSPPNNVTIILTKSLQEDLARSPIPVSPKGQLPENTLYAMPNDMFVECMDYARELYNKEKAPILYKAIVQALIFQMVYNLAIEAGQREATGKAQYEKELEEIKKQDPGYPGILNKDPDK